MLAALLASADLILFTDARNNYLVDPGSTATYIAYNNGTETAQNLVLEFPSPQGSKFVSLDATGGWTCAANDAEMLCTMAELPAMKFGDQPTRARATVVLSSDRNGFFSSSIATVTSRTPDSVPLNNQSQISTIVYRMLSVSSTADSGCRRCLAGSDCP